MSICVVGVIVSYCIFRSARENSFMYNDEEQMEQLSEESDKEINTAL